MNSWLSKASPMLMGISLKCWTRSLLNAGVAISNLPSVCLVSFVIFCLTPLRLYEYFKLRKIIPKIKLGQPPIFIIGVHRSGTTHLHNILSKHSSLGYLTSTEATAFPISHLISTPGSYLNRNIKNFKMKRSMDNMVISSDLPQEEEFALGTISPWSFTLGGVLKNHLNWCIENTLLANNPDANIISQWKRAYDYTLKKITFLRQGKPLILKNPVNTSRIKWLLELYPDAKFIHIYRNPYDVFPSMLNLFTKVGEGVNTQHDPVELEKSVFKLYTILLQGYLDQQKLIPPQNLVEVRYEDLEKKPLDEVKRIFDQLNISYTQENMNDISNYINTQKNYEKNKFTLDQETIEKIYQHWDFTIDKWGYAYAKK